MKRVMAVPCSGGRYLESNLLRSGDVSPGPGDNPDGKKVGLRGSG